LLVLGDVVDAEQVRVQGAGDGLAFGLHIDAQDEVSVLDAAAQGVLVDADDAVGRLVSARVDDRVRVRVAGRAAGVGERGGEEAQDDATGPEADGTASKGSA
jgi:hypothetical protein